MKHLTTETFSEVLTGNSLVFFHRLSGCPNCAKMLPLVEEFEKEWVQVFALDADQSKELVGKYAPQGNWNLPLAVYMENGKAINVKTGVTDLLEATKTLQNIDINELTEIGLNLQLEVATIRKQLFQAEKNLTAVMSEDFRRKSPIEIPVEDFPLPTETATTAPVELCESCT